jgi:hypothetical protein
MASGKTLAINLVIIGSVVELHLLARQFPNDFAMWKKICAANSTSADGHQGGHQKSKKGKKRLKPFGLIP